MVGDRRQSSSSPSLHDLHKPTYYASGIVLFTFSNLWSQPFVLLKKRQQIGLVVDDPGGTFRLLRGISKSEGISGLFRSGGIAWVAGVSRMNYFTAYETFADVLGGYADCGVLSEGRNDDDGSRRVYPSWVWGAAGGLSSLVSQLIMAPYSVVSTRLQIATGSTRESAFTVLKDVAVGPGGVRSLWTGYLSAVVQLGPQHATMWAVSSFLQDAIVVKNRDSGGMSKIDEGYRRGSEHDVRLGLLSRLATSACGSIIAIFVTSPFEIVRTHRQAMASNATSIMSESLAAGISRKGGVTPSSWVVFSRLYRRDGPGVFVRGIVPRCYAHCPGMITMIVGYDYVKDLAFHVQQWK